MTIHTGMTAPIAPVTSEATGAPAHVRIVEVSKRLGDFAAVRNISLDIKRGEMLTLLGPSGCGKSTTLRLLAGFYQPTEGEIFLGDTRITMLPPNQRQMTMVFQEYALFPHLRTSENVGYGLKRRRLPKAQAEARIVEMLELVGLATSGEKYPHQLSGGQQQRVALARALAVDPEVLLLDEPLSNLDARLRVRLREEIVRLQKVLGKTMVFVTHDQEEALSISDRIAVMKEGRIEQLGTPDEIYFKPRSRYVAEFVGTANFLPVDVLDAGTIRLGSKNLSFAAGHAPGAATLMARPHALKLTEGGSPAAIPELRGVIERKAFHGSTTRLWAKTSFGDVIVDDSNSRGWPIGAQIGIEIDTNQLHVLGADD